MRSRGGAIFGRGPAFACAVAQIGSGGDVEDSEQWCNKVELIPE